jgi:hypothetical protein
MLANGMTLETIRAVTDAATGTVHSIWYPLLVLCLEDTVRHVAVPELQAWLVNS